MSTIPKVDAAQIPEVVAFLEAQQRLESLKAQYPGIFDELAELEEQYNTLLEAADKAVRASAVSSGPFELYQFKTTYNANALYDEVGREEFLKLGGSIQTVQQLDVDKKVFDANVAQNKISKALADKVKQRSPNYHKPNKICIP